jgi:hypothetical protein
VILITSIIKRKEKFQFIKVQILVRKSPTVLDSIVDLIDVNQWRIQEFLNGEGGVVEGRGLVAALKPPVDPGQSLGGGPGGSPRRLTNSYICKRWFFF